ncbi:MAG: adenylate/guanylate cyclase domain-containing protein [Actinomycetota bacterium]
MSQTAELPSGMLTVMFTDVEGSTSHWERNPESMRTAMADHDRLLSEAVAAFDGVVFKHTGDGLGAVFGSPDRAALCAVDMQRQLQAHDWQGIDRIKIRIGLHMGDIEPTSGDYFGPPVNRAARVMDVANGDQIAASEVVADFVRSVTMRRMGSHQLKGIGTEVISLLTADDLVTDDRALRARVSQAVKPLPAPAHRLIGRDRELERSAELVAQHQNVTIIGPGGVGKTSFALELGRRCQHRFADGAVLCEFAPVVDASAVLEVIAESIGARVQPEMTLLESIVNFLEGREMLILLDNCEHVIPAVHEFVEAVAPFGDIHVITTSRERLGLRSEQVFSLEPLTAETHAVELFLERARERDLNFEPNAEAMRAIRSICTRLDGIPLGVELAAAWVRVLTPEQLREHLAERFDVLERTRSRGHRQTLRETIQWSYEQLDDALKQLFVRLSVFSGGFSYEAAVAVCSQDEIDDHEVLDLMMSLVDKSMIMTDRGSGQIRFTMLETLRQFGVDELVEAGQLDELRDRHAEFFRALAKHEAAQLVSEKEAEVWDLLDREWANIRTTFNHLLDVDRFDDAAELVLELGWFAGLSLRMELFAWLAQLVERPGLEDRPSAGSMVGLTALAEYFTINPNSVQTAKRGLELDPVDMYGFGRCALAADSLNNVLDAAESDARTRDWLDALTDESPALARLWAHGMRVFHICSQDPSEQALEHHQVLSQLANRTGSASAIALARWAGGMVASFQSINAALAEWRQGLDSARSINDVHLLVHLIVGLELHFTASHGDLDTVLDRCLSILTEAHDQHYLAGTSHLFGVTAIILARVDRAEVGAELLGSMHAHGHVPRENARRRIDAALGDRAELAERRGHALSTNEAAALATSALREAIEERTDDD